MYNEFFQRISYNFTSHLQNNLHLTEYNLCISNEPSLFQGLVCRCSNLMTVAVCSIAYRSCCMGFEPRTQRRVTKSSTFATDSFATREGKPTQDCNGNWKPSARCLEKFIKAMSLLQFTYHFLSPNPQWRSIWAHIHSTKRASLRWCTCGTTGQCTSSRTTGSAHCQTWHGWGHQWWGKKKSGPKIQRSRAVEL